MVKETIATYKRYIPGIIDLNGKKDFTLGAVIETELVSTDNDDDEDAPPFNED